jgi:hypothetical protein
MEFTSTRKKKTSLKKTGAEASDENEDAIL